MTIHVLIKHNLTIPGMSPRDLLEWAGVPEEHLSPDYAMKPYQITSMGDWTLLKVQPS